MSSHGNNTLHCFFINNNQYGEDVSAGMLQQIWKEESLALQLQAFQSDLNFEELLIWFSAALLNNALSKILPVSCESS